jgi:transcriptional regulator with XRE-family HTH domain
MSARPIASPFPTLRPVKLPDSVIRPTEPAAQAPRSSAAVRVGSTVRLLRKNCAVSARALAQRAGVSRSLLSRLERGLISPSLDTLESLAAALGTSSARLLLEPSAQNGFCHVRAGQGIRVEQAEGGDIRHELLGHLLPGLLAVEPCLVVQQRAELRTMTSGQDGVRFMYVISGRGMCVHGSRAVQVTEGDALVFDATVPHGIQALEGQVIAHLSILFTLRT